MKEKPLKVTLRAGGKTLTIVGKPGRKGDPGKPGPVVSASAIAAALKRDTSFLASVKGEPGEPGKDAESEVIVREENLSAEAIRDRLESLTGGSRLSVRAIKGVDELIVSYINAVGSSVGAAATDNVGATAFLQLTDVPGSYSGQAGKALRVNAGATGLEFYTPVTSVAWGSITGTLSAQTDLQAALDAKVAFSDLTVQVPAYETDPFYSANTYAVGMNQDVDSGASVTFAQVSITGQLAAINGAPLSWPAANAAGQLTNDGSGNLSWAAGGVTDHGALTGLGDDDHTQYALLAGRSGGQTINGGTATGDDLTLKSTSHSTKGTIFLGTTGVSAYDETTRALIIGDTGNFSFTQNVGRLDVIRGGAQVTSGFGWHYPLAVFSSTYGGNSNAAIAITGRTATGAGANSAIVMGPLGDPDEAAIAYEYDTDSLKFYLGGNSNPDYVMKGGANIQFGWGYSGTPASTSKLYLGLAGNGSPRYIALQSGAYGIWESKIGWDVEATGGSYPSTAAIGQLTLSNVVSNVSNVNILTVYDNRFGINETNKLSTLSLKGAADTVSRGTTTANAATTITGVNTAFLRQIAVGDRISLSSASSTYATVTAIASETSLTVDAALGNGTTQTINVKHGVAKFSTAAGAASLFVSDTGAVGIGNVKPSAWLHIIGTTEQLRAGYDASNYWSATTASTGAVTFDAVGSGAGFTFADDVILADAKNIQTNATTGTKIGTATAQKLGFWNATPIVQPSGAGQAALTNSTGGTGDGTLVDVTTAMVADPAKINDNFTEVFALLDALRTALVNAGLVKGSA